MPGFIGLPELLLLALVALVLFGPKRLPEMGRSLGKGMREFKDSISGENGIAEHLHLEAPNTRPSAVADAPSGEAESPTAPRPDQRETA